MAGAKFQPTPKNIGLFLITLSSVFSAIYSLAYRSIISLFERCCSPDHQVTPGGERQLTSAFYFVMALLFITGLGFIKIRDSAGWNRLKEILVKDPLCIAVPFWISPRIVFIASSFIGFLLIISMRLAPGSFNIYLLLYSKDHGILDIFVPIAAVTSATLLGSAGWKLRTALRSIKQSSLLSVVYLLMAGMFVIYAGEEVSWGQDFFKWSSPSLFSGNVEGQTRSYLKNG